MDTTAATSSRPPLETHPLRTLYTVDSANPFSTPLEEAIASTPPAVTDTVTISPEAEKAAADGTSGTATKWSSDAASQAMTALNDTSGKTSLADQLSAYKTLAAMIADAKNFDPAKAENADAVKVATAFATSSYVQHYQSVMAQFNAFSKLDGERYAGQGSSDAEQRQLDYFNSLSDQDQQILLQTRNASSAAIGQKTNYATTDDYKARQQATIAVSRTMEAMLASPGYADAIAAKQDTIKNSALGTTAATMDIVRQKAEADHDTKMLDLLNLVGGGGKDYAAQTQSYFDKYGAAPAQSDASKAANAAAPLPSSGYRPESEDDVRAFFTDLATLADTSGKVSGGDLGLAYRKVNNKAMATFDHDNGGVLWIAGWKAAETAGGSLLVKDARAAWMNQDRTANGPSRTGHSQCDYSAFERLSSSDQEMVAGLNGFASAKSDKAATPDEFRNSLIDGIVDSAVKDVTQAHDEAKRSGGLMGKTTILGVDVDLSSVMVTISTRTGPYTCVSPDVKAQFKKAAQAWAKNERATIEANKASGPAATNVSPPPTKSEKQAAATKAYTPPMPKIDAKALEAVRAFIRSGGTDPTGMISFGGALNPGQISAPAQPQADANNTDSSADWTPLSFTA